MDHSPGSPNDPNRTFNVRLVRIGPSPSGQVPHTPGSLTVQVTATSGLNARNAAQVSYPGYTVGDATERRS